MSDAAGTSWLDTGRAGLVRRAAGGERAVAGRDAAAGRGLGGLGHAARRAGGALGDGDRRGRRRRRRRQRGLRRGGRRGGGGAGLRVAGHLGGAVRGVGRLSPRPGDGGAHLLPRAARNLAPDGGDPGRDGRAATGWAACWGGTRPR